MAHEQRSQREVDVIPAQGSDQQSLTVDDGLGVRVVRSTFDGHEEFDWDLFQRVCIVPSADLLD